MRPVGRQPAPNIFPLANEFANKKMSGAGCDPSDEYLGIFVTFLSVIYLKLSKLTW